MTTAFDPEAIASRFAARDGCRFIGYKAVGIAVFSMSLRVLAIEAREVPPIEEFLLRLLGEQVESLTTLAALLGLDRHIVRSRLVELRRRELIDVVGSSDAGDAQCRLTERGREASHSLRQQTMHEITVPTVIVHGLLRRPFVVGHQARRQYLTPKEARKDGLTLIRAIPIRPPHPEEISVDVLDRVVKRGHRPKPGEKARDIVAIKSVLKNVSTLYEPAIMLEYETADERRERQVAFAVEGKMQDEYEATFARIRGPELLPDIMTPRCEPLELRLQQLVPRKFLRQLGRLDDVEELASKVVAAKQELEDARQELENVDRPDTRLVLREKIAQLEKEKARLEGERSERKVKYLWTPEIREKLWDALRTAKDRLLILSGFISSEVVDTAFVDALRQALARGVMVWIGYGFDKGVRRGDELRAKTEWREAEIEFEKLAKEFPDRFRHRDIGRSHEKRLICDNRFTFGGSFNLLSFSGERRGAGKVRHEGADLIEDSAFCQELYQRYLRMFFS